MKDLFDGLCENRVLLCALTGWLSAQVIKALLNVIITKKWSWDRLLGSGGMPSSHAATVCALAVAVLINYGASSVVFAISVILTVIVLHDARGVRLEAGKQAAILNHIINNVIEGERNPFADVQLKELVGHTPLQVFVGSLLGIVVGLLMG